MDLQICYKGYVLKVEILRVTGYKDRFRLKGLCKEVGFEFVSEMDENVLSRLKEKFREQVDYSINEVKVPIEKFVEVESLAIGEETLVGYLKRISRHSTSPNEINEALIQVADLFAGVLPYNLRDIKKRYFALLEIKEGKDSD